MAILSEAQRKNHKCIGATNCCYFEVKRNFEDELICNIYGKNKEHRFSEEEIFRAVMEHEYIKLLPKGYYVNGKAWDNSLYDDADFKELEITVQDDCENYKYNSRFYTGDMPSKIYSFNLLNHKWNLVWGSSMKVYSRLR